MNECGASYRLNSVPDGVQALEFLRRQNEFVRAPRPDVILLDWNLPRMDGREVLREIKNDVQLRDIPVLVLTTSSAEKDIHKAYDLHANCFITKPVSVHRFFEIIGEVHRFWLGTATLPPRTVHA